MFGLCRFQLVSLDPRNGYVRIGHDSTYLVRVTDLLDDIVNLSDGQLDDLLFHPLGDLQLFDELVFDVRDNSIAKFFGFSREGLLNEEAAQKPP